MHGWVGGGAYVLGQTPRPQGPLCPHQWGRSNLDTNGAWNTSLAFWERGKILLSPNVLIPELARRSLICAVLLHLLGRL